MSSSTTWSRKDGLHSTATTTMSCLVPLKMLPPMFRYVVFIAAGSHEGCEGCLGVTRWHEVADAVDGFVVTQGYRFQLLPGNHVLDAYCYRWPGDSGCRRQFRGGKVIQQAYRCYHPLGQAPAIGGTKWRLRSIPRSGC